MTIELALLVGVLTVGTTLGSLWRWNNGRIRPAAPGESAMRDRAGRAGRAWLSSADLGAELGERATLVQFSSAFCAPCRTTRVVLKDIAARVAGIGHVEIDAESRLDLVRRFGVLRTPTVLVLDADGQIVVRASGAPRRADVLSALEQAVLHARH